MKKNLMHVGLAVLVLCMSIGMGFGCSKALEPVKEIHVAGKPVDQKTMLFSKVNTPIASDALVQVPGKQESIIVNVFPSDDKGAVKSGIKPKVIMVSGTDHFKLDQTMSKDDLVSGTYIMNIVYGGKTDRVLFSVK